MSQQNPACQVLEALKKEVEASDLPDKKTLGESIDRLIDIKHCDGRRRK
jgi:hypothetical protein